MSIDTLPSRIKILSEKKTIAILTMAAILFRLMLLSDKSIVGDESSTLNLIKMSWSDLLRSHYPGEFNPPLYFLVLKGWSLIFGQSELALRFPSVIFSASALPLIYLTCRTIVSKNAALTASWIYLLSPLSIEYAQIARSYSLILFCAALSLYAYMRLLTSPTPCIRTLFVLCLCNLIGLYTHYFFCLLWMVEALSLVLFWSRFQWQIKHFTVGSILGLLIYLPQAPVLIHQVSNVMNIEQKQATLGFILKFLLIVYGLVLGEFISPLNLIYVGPAFFLLSLVILLASRSVLRKREPLLLIPFLCVLLPIIVVSLTGVARPMYGIFVLPSVLFSLSIVLHHVKLRTIRYIFLVTITLVSVRADAYWYQKDPKQVINSGLLIPMREVAEAVKSQWRQGDSVLLFPEWSHYSFHHYFKPPSTTHSVLSLSRNGYKEELQKVDGSFGNRIWLVAEYDDDDKREGLKNYLKNEGWQIASYQGFVPNDHLIDRIKGKPSEIYYSLEVLLMERKKTH